MWLCTFEQDTLNLEQIYCKFMKIHVMEHLNSQNFLERKKKKIIISVHTENITKLLFLRLFLKEGRPKGLDKLF